MWLVSSILCPFLLPDISLKVVTYYNQLHEADEKISCKDFDLNITIEESKGN